MCTDWLTEWEDTEWHWMGGYWMQRPALALTKETIDSGYEIAEEHASARPLHCMPHLLGETADSETIIMALGEHGNRSWRS